MITFTEDTKDGAVVITILKDGVDTGERAFVGLNVIDMMDQVKANLTEFFK